MIAGLRITNVRNFADDDWYFPLAPLVTICGTNSAGKSTLLKALFLLGASVDVRPLDGIPVLNFSGAGIDVGEFDALVSQNDRSRELGIGVEITMPFRTRELAWWLVPSALREPRTLPTPLVEEQPEPVRFSAEWRFRSTTEGGPEGLARAEFALRTDNELLGGWQVHRAPADDPTGRPLQLEFDQRLFARAFNHYGDYRFAGQTTSETGVTRVACNMRGLLPDGIYAMAPGAPEADRLLTLPLPTEVQRPLEALGKALQSLQYIGPLRTPAERYYFAGRPARAEGDLAGQAVPYVLRDRADEPVNHRMPVSREAIEEPLIAGVNRWLSFLRAGRSDEAEHELAVEARHKALVEIEVSDAAGAGHYPLADSGFGYSQLLPIIVAGLRLPAKSTLIVEQPELHLHPALQMRLAEFFLGISLDGRQVLLETHSEHLVNAIRVAVAEDNLGELDDHTRIYFIDGSTAPPRVHSLSIARDGTVPDWPSSFFGEALTLSTRLLRAQRRDRGHDTE